MTATTIKEQLLENIARIERLRDLKSKMAMNARSVAECLRDTAGFEGEHSRTLRNAQAVERDLTAALLTFEVEDLNRVITIQRAQIAEADRQASGILLPGFNPAVKQ